ncbi:MAG: DUF368 domain-containing protein [Polaribacter sp.]|nr:MAG: DUF368 domain-containing protein [Polaribacter sp.]
MKKYIIITLTSISNINLSLLKTLKKEGIKQAWTQLNGNFLASLFLGIGISIVSLAKVISWLLIHQPILLWSFFFGLVLASIIYIAKQITKWSFLSFILVLIGAGIAYQITILPPLVSENPSALFLFISGALAICAMILPGISGSFILVLLGAYKPIINAIKTLNFKTIAVVGIGAIVGLLSFSRVLKYLFNHHKNSTLAILTGFIVGSLNKIWPWKKVLTFRTNSHGEQVPFNELSISPFSYEQIYNKDSQLWFAIILAIFGFGLILLLERLADRNEKK